MTNGSEYGAADAARRLAASPKPAVPARGGGPPEPPDEAADAARRLAASPKPAVPARGGTPPEPPDEAADAARRLAASPKPAVPARGGTVSPGGHPRTSDGAESPDEAANPVRRIAASPASLEGVAPGDGEAPGPVLLLEPRDGPPLLVASADDLSKAVDAMAKGEGPVAVDAERASGFRYGHRAFLVQLRRRGAGTMLIDPVPCPNLSGLDAAIADAEVVQHAASQDLPCLTELGFRPRALFDTELAGRLLGFPRVGLGALVESVLGWTLEKGHAAADWSVRSLSAELLRYAALDVELLVELRDALAILLAEQGKTEWAEQEFAAVLAAKPPGPRPDPWRRTSGIHRVHTRRGLAIVRELWRERDKIARRRDLSPGRVLPDTAIVEAARALPGSRAGLGDLPAFQGRGARKHTSAWLRAVHRVRGQADTDL